MFDEVEPWCFGVNGGSLRRVVRGEIIEELIERSHTYLTKILAKSVTTQNLAMVINFLN